jgi:hypothetical protein
MKLYAPKIDGGTDDDPEGLLEVPDAGSDAPPSP